MSEEAVWRRRFRAALITLPDWARDAPDRLLHVSSESGRFELHTWDRATGARRRVTDRPEGTGLGARDPSGGRGWWLDDARGDEVGTWRVEPFTGGVPPRPAAPGVEAAYPAGLALGRGFAIVGTSTDAGSRVWLSA